MKNGTSKAGHRKSVALTDGERLEMSTIRNNLVSLKIRLADLTTQFEILENQKRQLIAEIIKSGELFNGQVGTFARAHGIDPNDPTKGRWNFDPDSMTFQPTS